MASDRERDAEMDRLLRAALAEMPARTAEPCPSADDLAAYVERTLAEGEREALETHFAACERCQHALALMATVPEAPATRAAATTRAWWLGGWRRWLVPVSALASALILYVALKPEATLRPGSPPAGVGTGVESTAPERGAAAPAPPGRALADAASPSEKTPAPRKEEARRTPPAAPAPVVARIEAKQRGALEPVPQLAAAPAVVAPPPPPVAPEAVAEGQAREAAPGAVGGVLTMRPTQMRTVEELPAKGSKPAAADMALAAPAQASSAAAARAESGAAPTIVKGGGARPFLWRFDPGGRIFGSADGGRTWQLQHEGPGELAAGVSPSPGVCWAVGAGGLVLRTTDGQAWQVIPFPERLDLVAVTATSALHATVHAPYGRQFTTEDGGGTWTQKP